MIFAHFFCTASVRSRSLDQPRVPGVFTHFFKIFFLCLLLFTHFGETPVAEHLSKHYDFLFFFFCSYFFASFASEQ